MGFRDILAQLPPPHPAPYYIDLLAGRAREAYPLLRHIDAYGQTCFNSLQARALGEELNRLEAGGLSQQELSLVRALRVLLAIQVADVHRYLWFIGD